MLNTVDYFARLIKLVKTGHPDSICSVCSSNKFVIDAALEEAVRKNRPVLIESTANQVNQFGGYTGMRPAEFAKFVLNEAHNLELDDNLLILGGDHLGPLVWSKEPESSAMEKATQLVSEYAAAGFQKIHLDCSMRLADDDPNLPLSVEKVAERAASLALAVEANATNPPVYIIGSEVPIPGGATEAEKSLSVTKPEDLFSEYRAFREAFYRVGLTSAWDRVVGVVVQPGVEFGDNQVFLYNPEAAKDLVETAKNIPGIVLEGHSTDYQPSDCLAAMRNDGISILKVGPALTFAAREALYALEKIEKVIYDNKEIELSNFEITLENAMLNSPDNWIKHYHGDEATLALMRRYSLSDRSRYYMEEDSVQSSITKLLQNIDNSEVPLGLLHQFLPEATDALISGEINFSASALVKENVCAKIRTYY